MYEEIKQLDLTNGENVERYRDINIRIEYPNGDFVIGVRTDMKVSQLIELIEQKINAKDENAKLFYHIERLREDNTLDYYHIKNNATLKFTF